MKVIVVTGMSGAGKTTAMEALEDIGYFCVDNVPPPLLPKLIELNTSSQHQGNMAIGVDVRSLEDFGNFSQTLLDLIAQHVDMHLLFIDADDRTILTRYKENRRKHPLARGENTTLEQAISRERQIMEPLRVHTEFYIDASVSSVKALGEQIRALFDPETGSTMVIQCMSFGYKYRLPMEADLVFDVRCLPNPYYDVTLRPLTGLDTEIQEFVMQAPESQELLQKILDLLDFLLPLYQKEGKSRLVVAVGCTGGKHRSVTFVEKIAAYFQEQSYPVVVNHRDKDRHTLE